MSSTSGMREKDKEREKGRMRAKEIATGPPRARREFALLYTAGRLGSVNLFCQVNEHFQLYDRVRVKRSTGVEMEGVISRVHDRSNVFDVDFPDGSRDKGVETKALTLV